MACVVCDGEIWGWLAYWGSVGQWVCGAAGALGVVSGR